MSGLGLASYESSEEEDSVKESLQKESTNPTKKRKITEQNDTSAGKQPLCLLKRKKTNELEDLTSSNVSASIQPTEVIVVDEDATEVTVGPESNIEPPRASHGEAIVPGPARYDDIASSPVSSDPYAGLSLQQIIHNLTLPPVPNTNIPPSPPDSPAPSTQTKFDRFLQLKKQNIHFNERLGSSSALKNPQLLDKLRELTGLEDDDMYANTLPPGTAPYLPEPGTQGFASWAYVNELDLLQEKESKKKQAERLGQKRTFVASSGGEESIASKTSDRRESQAKSIAARVTGNVNKNQSRSPYIDARRKK